MAQLLSREGTVICELSGLRFAGPVTRNGTAFTANFAGVLTAQQPTTTVILVDDEGRQLHAKLSRTLGSSVSGEAVLIEDGDFQ